MIRNYFRVIHITVEDFHMKHPAGTRRHGDVPWRSPKGPNVQYLQGTFRQLSGDQYKDWWFYEKNVFQK